MKVRRWADVGAERPSVETEQERVMERKVADNFFDRDVGEGLKMQT